MGNKVLVELVKDLKENLDEKVLEFTIQFYRVDWEKVKEEIKNNPEQKGYKSDVFMQKQYTCAEILDLVIEKLSK